jgi:mono/diheme cytochrome c family protein
MRLFRVFRSRPRPTNAALALLAIVVAGCGSKLDYPPNLAFPSRTDRLVLKSPEATPTSIGEPGKIDDEIARLDELGGKTADPAVAPPETRATIDRVLKEAFGMPASPSVSLSTELEVSTVSEKLGLTTQRLTEGSKLFRTHCLKCHNLAGDGRGPAGLWVTPYPRDFRRGVFKFVTTGGKGKPRRADLVRTITTGLRGTAMPPFGLLPEGERDLLAGFVTYLSIRGQVEYQTFEAVLTRTTVDVAGLAAECMGAVLSEWEKAEGAPAFPKPPDDGEPDSPTYQAAVKRGFELFTRKTDNSCITCHADFGRKPVLRYDIWGTVSRPADLVAVVPAYKGGATPEDFFARIRGGITAVGMPAHPELSERQVWDLVRFVKSAPFHRELPPEVRKSVYPDSGGAP